MNWVSYSWGSPDKNYWVLFSFPFPLPLPFFEYYSVQPQESCPPHTNKKPFPQAQNLQLTVLKVAATTGTPILLIFCFRESNISENSSLKEVSCWDSHGGHRIVFSPSLLCLTIHVIQTQGGKVVLAEGTRELLGYSMNRNRKKGLLKRSVYSMVAWAMICLIYVTEIRTGLEVGLQLFLDLVSRNVLVNML